MPRSDWSASRQRLVCAAMELGREKGLDFALADVACRAGLAQATLYRHFPTRDDLFTVVMSALAEPVMANAAEALAIPDPGAAFRAVLAHCCGMTPRDVALFAALAAVSPCCQAHAEKIIVGVVAPAAARLRRANRLRPGITDADLALFVRMIELAGTPEQRTKARDLILEGLVLPAR